MLKKRLNCLDFIFNSTKLSSFNLFKSYLLNLMKLRNTFTFLSHGHIHTHFKYVSIVVYPNKYIIFIYFINLLYTYLYIHVTFHSLTWFFTSYSTIYFSCSFMC